jgi:hypothetical protein
MSDEDWDPFMTGPPAGTWVTVAQAAHAHGKSVETIRRWARDYPYDVPSKLIGGITHLHEGALREIAAEHPAPNPERKACTREGHVPVGDPAAWDEGDLITVLDASDRVARTKTAILRWAGAGAVRSLTCRCGGRAYIYADDLEPARQRYERNRKRPMR